MATCLSPTPPPCLNLLVLTASWRPMPCAWSTSPTQTMTCQMYAHHGHVASTTGLGCPCDVVLLRVLHPYNTYAYTCMHAYIHIGGIQESCLQPAAAGGETPCLPVLHLAYLSHKPAIALHASPSCFHLLVCAALDVVDCRVLLGVHISALAWYTTFDLCSIKAERYAKRLEARFGALNALSDAGDPGSPPDAGRDSPKYCSRSCSTSRPMRLSAFKLLSFAWWQARHITCALNVLTAPGDAIPLFWGVCRLSPQLFW